MKNERSRFEKRARSFQKTTAFVFQKQRLQISTAAPREFYESASRRIFWSGVYTILRRFAL